MNQLFVVRFPFEVTRAQCYRAELVSYVQLSVSMTARADLGYALDRLIELLSKLQNFLRILISTADLRAKTIG